ncbi:MAG: triphosphoribosyl-dephospho-CoA synthase [Methanosarcinaceae archaeon]|nr:triphosphoribosyl-dephospho-CoA synthase [Methanosarcinaceae archaeon]
MNVRLKRPLVSGYTSNSYTVASYIARCVQLAMVMEVSAHPKPGNVDRTHDYEDTRFEHFLASAVSIYPVMENAANSTDNKGSHGVGFLIHSAVRESANWQNGGNTHFGAFILLVPLAIAAGNIFQKKHEFTIDELVSCAHDIVKRTNTQDAIEFYKSFETAKVRVNPVDEFDLQDIGSIDSLDDDNITLYDLMEISKGYDMIANEWVNGFERCANCGETLIKCMDTDKYDESTLDVNDAVVYAFMKTLSENRDTFIQTKFDEKTADYVSGRAHDILLEFKPQEAGFDAVRLAVEEFDDELLSKGINPGSTADIVIAGLFIALLGGVRF